MTKQDYKIIVRQLFYLVLFTLFVCCTENKQRYNFTSSQDLSTINLTKEQVFGDTADVIFDRVGLVDVDNNNRVYISERSLGNRTIHVFSEDGNYLTNVSREGNGPGEFRTLGYLQVLSNKLYLFDSFHNRISIFTINSDSNTYSFRENKNISTRSLSQIKKAEDKRIAKTYVFREGESLVGFEDPQIPSNSERRIYYFLFNSKGELVKDETLFEQNGITIFKTKVNSRSITMELPFSRRPLIEVSHTGLIFKAWSEDFKIDVLKSSGEQIRTISIPFKNTPLKKSEVIQWYESNNYFHRAIQKASFPETWPALNDFIVDDENRIWVSTIVENFDIHEWWVLKRSGEVITKFEWPRDKPIEKIKNGYMYTRETNEMGVETIVRYEIEMDEG